MAANNSISDADVNSPGDEPLGMDEQTEAERQSEFTQRCRRVARNLIFRQLEDLHLRNGERKRRVSGNCGRLMHALADQSLEVIMQRIEPGLTLSLRRTVRLQLNLLENNWGQDLQQTDRTFLQNMGSLRDPDRDLLEQRITLLFQRGQTLELHAGSKQNSQKARRGRQRRRCFFLQGGNSDSHSASYSATLPVLALKYQTAVHLPWY